MGTLTNGAPDPPARWRASTWLLAAAAVVALAVVARLAPIDARVDPPGERSAFSAWRSTDVDGVYHARRVHRALEEGLPIAGSDPYLNAPFGSAIPAWPPYYDTLLYALLAPFAPEDTEASRLFVERATACMPALWSVLTALLCLVLASRLANPAAGVFAAVYFALADSAVQYSALGVSDHHAFVSMLNLLLLGCLQLGLARGALDQPARALRTGAAAGAVAGVALGSWSGYLVHILAVDLFLGLLLLGRRNARGVAALAIGFHAAALLVAMPAVLASPWSSSHPWSVINVSWFHPCYLALAAGVFGPLATARAGARVPLAYAPSAAVTVGALAAVLFAIDAPVAQGITEAISFASRGDAFVSEILESTPLVGPRALGWEFGLRVLGYAALALPVVWILGWRAALGSRPELLPWLVAVGVIGAQAAQQLRFTEALAGPMAVTLGWGAGQLVQRLALHGRWRVLGPIGAGVIAALAQAPHVGVLADRYGLAPEATTVSAHRRRAVLGMCEWLRSHRADPPGSVLAHWNWGHLIEWTGDHPSIATNFGSYVGEESFAVPPRFFLCEDNREALSIADRREVRFVLLTSALPQRVAPLARVLAPDSPPAYGTDPRQAEKFNRWQRTLGARMLFAGVGIDLSATDLPPLPRTLRLVHVSPLRDATAIPGTRVPAPMGWIWEHVPGALLQAEAPAGEVLEVRLTVNYPASGTKLVYQDRTTADTDGIARLRVPYATTAANGEGVVAHDAQWTVGERSGALVVPAAAVLAGDVVALR